MRDLNIQKTTIGYVSTTVTEAVNDEENSVETTAIPTTTTRRIRTEQPRTTRKNTLPPTLAKLRNLYTKTTAKPIVKETETENYPKIPFVPEKAIKIDINELFGISNVIIPKTTEGPLKISVNLDQIDDNSREIINKDNMMSTTDNKFIFEEISTTELISEPEKLKPTSAKQEIQELLADAMSRDNLLHILEARNMTLSELLEQRERGSSQRHLADIFHNQTREPEPKEVIVDHIVKQKVVENPFLDRRTIVPRPSLTINKEVKYPEIKPEYLQPLDEPVNSREARQNQFLRKQTEDYNILNNPLFRTDTKKTNEVINKLIPVWRQAYTNMKKPNPQTELPDNFMNEDLLLKDEAQRVEEIENQIAEAVNGALNEVETISHKITEEDESYLHLPYGVRSAVIASATIVGISLFVFVTIFIIFKWSQKKHKRLSYSNSLSSLKIRSPILETQYQKRIFGQILDSTLGRNKNISTISTSEPQSMQDYLWENDRKPFQ